jgi:hypothetical protein
MLDQFKTNLNLVCSGLDWRVLKIGCTAICT